MFPDSPILDYSDSLAFALNGRSDSRPFTHGDNSGNIHDEIVNKLFAASTTRTKMPPKKARGRLRQSEVSFHSLTTLSLPIILSNQAFALFLSRIAQVFGPAIVISDKSVEEVNIVCVDNFIF